MARQYSPKDFLRRAPNKLLKRYLATHDLATDIPWERLGETEIDPIFKAIDGAPENIRSQIDTDFRAIEGLADEGGTGILIEEGRDPRHRVELAENLGQMDGHLEKAFWVFMQHPSVFEVASRFDYADNLRFDKRKDLPPMQSPPDEESRVRLEDALSEYYSKQEGRGRGRQVDYYQRGERHYWFAFLEDYAESRAVYDEDHKLKIEPQRPAFEVIIIYHEAERSLDIHAKGGKRVRIELQKIFGRTILGADLNDPPDDDVTYELDGLLDRDFEFPTDIRDGIEAVRVKRLKLKIMGREPRAITLEARSKGNSKAVHDLLDDVLASDRIPRDLLRVTHAGLQFVLQSDGNRRPRTLTFTVSHPNSCSLRADPRHEVAKEYLKKWGLDVSGRADYTPPKPRLDAQYRLWR